MDEAACSSRGILLARIPSERTGNAASTAEMGVYLLLAALRQHNGMGAAVQSRTLGAPLGRQLKGLKVLVVGWGNIARELAVRLAPFGVELSAVRRSPWGSGGGDDEVAALLVSKGVASVDTHAMLGEADAVVLACNQTAENRGMVSAAFLGAMKEGAALVNVARGGLFDRDALLAALESGHLGYLASDVAWAEPVDPSDAVVNHPNAYFTPHVGGVTDTSYGTMGGIVAGAARGVLAGRGPGDDTMVVNLEAVKAAGAGAVAGAAEVI